MRVFFRRKRRVLILAGDFILLVLAFLTSVWLRYGTLGEPGLGGLIRDTLPVAVLLQVGILFLMKLYRGMFRYAGMRELVRVVLANLLATLATLVVVFSFGLLGRPQGMALGVFLIDSLLGMAFVGGSRVVIRMGYEHQKSRARPQSASGRAQHKRVIIYGAGDAGESIAREAEIKRTAALEILGFVDDNPKKVGLSLHGKPILGNGEDLQRLTASFKVDEVIIATPTATGEEMKKIVQSCRKALVPYRTLPGIAEVMDGRVELSQVRDLRIEDLLRRPPVETDREGIGRFLWGKRVMVTGAGGSIGSELCRQILSFAPMGLILVEREEYNLFQIEQELKKSRRGIPFLPILADVADRDQMEGLLRETHPHAIFHAAAYKHVPLCESNVRAAFDNNVLGTQNVADLAASFGVEVFLLVSTDKAVKPSCVMGATKRACELYLRKLASGPESRITRYLTVRFGNVLDSSGSVIPTFREQIAKGGPVTVTHPEMTRFFMTIPESCQLILQAASLGRGGEVFILDMGQPIRILDLARDLIALTRLAPETHIPISFTGLRPGEKMHEELWNSDEVPVPTAHPKIMKARISSPPEMNGQLDWFGRKIPFMTERDVRKLLTDLVPEYDPSSPPASPVNSFTPAGSPGGSS